MKTQILLILFFFLGLSTSIAQFQQQQQLPPQASPQETSPSDHSRNFIDHIATKTNLTKVQKDSLTNIFLQFVENVKKYRAENNPQVIKYMQKIRDEKVKTLMHDDAKFEKYVLIMEEIKKQRQQQARPSGQSPEGASGNP
ncbi:MAG: hypothetical protein PHF97_01960 [Bacteroidales bacterium]|nr:hypothetical protein [Bacteroidales bacterium]MDD4602556.1 hypothetical protein [Bacteroidales bacterium]